MKLSTFKKILAVIEYPVFILPNKKIVPIHYHITEIWLLAKKFIDCGGVTRVSSTITFQLWYADDTEHRLSATKLLHIIHLFEEKIFPLDQDIVIEYQGETIGTYWVKRDNNAFSLQVKQTDCLAKETCGIPQNNTSCGGGGCC